MKWSWPFRVIAVLGASLGTANLFVFIAFTVSGKWRLEVDTPTLALQIALLTVFIVFGGFGLATLSVFGMTQIEKVVARRAEERAEELVNERLDRWEEDAVPGRIADRASPSGGQPEEVRE